MTELLILTPSLGMGGTERVLSILSPTFANNFDKVTIVVWKNTPIFYPLDSRIEIIWLSKRVNDRGMFYKMLWVRKFVKFQYPTVILSLLAPYNIVTLASLLGVKVPIIVAERSDPKVNMKGRVGRILRNLFYHQANGILCQTESMKKYFKGVLYRKSKVIFNPLLIPKEKIGIALRTPKDKLIVSVGRLAAFKNQILLIQSFKKFIESHPDYQLRIFGEGEERDNLNNYIISQHLEQNVFLMGKSTNVFEDIKNAKAFVLSSKYEGMPNALLEAMAVGLPCISTNVSGAVDIIKSGVNGYLCESNPEDISEKLKFIVDNPQVATSIGQHASKIADLLAAERINNEWISYINSFYSANSNINS